MKYVIAIVALCLIASESQAAVRGSGNVIVRGRNNNVAINNGGFGGTAAFAGRGINGTALAGRSAFVGRGWYGYGRGLGGYYGGGYSSFGLGYGGYGASYYGGAYSSFGLYGAGYLPAPAFNIGMYSAPQNVQVNETEVKPDGSVVYRTYNMIR